MLDISSVHASDLHEGVCPTAPVSKIITMCIERWDLALQEQVDVEQCKGIFPYGLPIVEVRLPLGAGHTAYTAGARLYLCAASLLMTPQHRNMALGLVNNYCSDNN